MVKLRLADEPKTNRPPDPSPAPTPLDTTDDVIASEIMCPLTGELIDRDDVDGLLDMYERLKKANDQIYAVLIDIRQTLAAKTEGDAKTRRIQGRRRKAKVEMPGDSWDQSVLKEAFNAYPQHRDAVLKIDTIGVKLREFKKLVNTSGPPDFEQFRSMVEKANRGQTGTPTITIEV